MPTLKLIALDDDQNNNTLPNKYFDIHFSDDVVLDLPIFSKAYTWNIFMLKIKKIQTVIRI